MLTQMQNLRNNGCINKCKFTKHITKVKKKEKRVGYYSDEGGMEDGGGGKPPYLYEIKI